MSAQSNDGQNFLAEIAEKWNRDSSSGNGNHDLVRKVSQILKENNAEAVARSGESAANDLVNLEELAAKTGRR